MSGMSAFNKTFGGSMGCLAAVVVAIGGCFVVCAGLASYSDSKSIQQAQAPPARADPARAARIEAAEQAGAQREIQARLAERADARQRANAEPAPHVVDFDGPEAILKPAGKAPRPPVVQSDEQKSQARLSAAKALLRDNRKATARKWLQRIVDEFPETEAAREARELLAAG